MHVCSFLPLLPWLPCPFHSSPPQQKRARQAQCHQTWGKGSHCTKGCTFFPASQQHSTTHRHRDVHWRLKQLLLRGVLFLKRKLSVPFCSWVVAIEASSGQCNVCAFSAVECYLMQVRGYPQRPSPGKAILCSYLRFALHLTSGIPMVGRGCVCDILRRVTHWGDQNNKNW